MKRMDSCMGVLVDSGIARVLKRLNTIDGKCMNSIASSLEVNMTYCYIVRLLREMRKEQLIRYISVGRERRVFLTKKGKNVARILVLLEDSIRKDYPKEEIKEEILDKDD